MLTGVIRLFAISNEETTSDYIQNRFWEINEQYLNNYFSRKDVPYFRIDNKDNICFLTIDKMPDGSMPTEEYEYTDEDGTFETRGGVYPFIGFWLSKDKFENDLLAKDYADFIVLELQKNSEEKKDSYKLLMNEFLKERVSYHLEIKRPKEKVAEMVLLILYIIAEKVNGIVHFDNFYYHNERINHIIKQANSLLDKVVDYKEFFNIVKSIIERED